MTPKALWLWSSLLMTSIVCMTAAIPGARAEERSDVNAETLEVSTSAEALKIPLRFNLNFDSESGGTPAFFSFDSFFPFHQQPGESLFYVSPRIRFDFEDENTFGGNVLVGYRTYSAVRERILGGYVAIDARDTGESVFPQIGFGFERLGRFDIRANGYVPIGDTNQITDSSTSESSVFTNAFFQGNQLILEGQNTITTVTEREVALGGFDVEAGGTIVHFNDGGRLGIYGGVYYLAGDNISAIGGRGRLELQPVKRVRLGVGVQGDDVFDTRVYFNASIQLPNPTELSSPNEAQQKVIDEAGDVVVRLGEPVVRTNTVIVDEQRDIDVETIAASEPAINPETGEPYFFIFVTPLATSSGTFEDPFGSVQEGLDSTLGDGNEIVLVSVQEGNEITIPAFTIPDNVRVWSDGIVQTLDTIQLGLLQLPGTGTGVIPFILGAVTQGTNTQLSGFVEVTQTNFDFLFDNTFDNTLTAPFVGSGSLSFDGIASVGSFSLASLTGLQVSFSFNSGDTFTEADIVTDLSATGINIFDAGGGDLGLVFTGGSGMLFGGSLDLQNSSSTGLSFEPTFSISDPVGIAGGDGVTNLFFLTDSFDGSYQARE